MIEIIETGLPKTIGLRLSGTLHDADYKSFVPAVEQIIAGQGKVRVFMEFQDLRGWDLHAAWDDLKFGLKHYADFDRIALVGKRRWQKWMAQVWKPFTRARSDTSTPRGSRMPGHGCERVSRRRHRLDPLTVIDRLSGSVHTSSLSLGP